MNMSQKVTFQWSRLIRDLETGEADENAVKFYQDVIDECKKNDGCIHICLLSVQCP